MCERIIAFLLCLYPAEFRDQYGEEYLQLIRDRSRDETGTWRKIRLWFDLLIDLAVSLPNEYRRAQPDWIHGSRQPCGEGIPAFVVLGSESPRRTYLLLGGLLSLLTLVAFPTLINHYGVQPPAGWTPDLIGAYARPPSKPRPISANGRAPSEAAQDADPKLDAAARHRIITSAVAALKQHHINPVTAQKAGDALLAHESNGDDNSLVTAIEFSRALTTQMWEATDDRDLEVLFSRRTIPEGGPSRLSAPLPPGYADQIRRINCGFERVETMPGNIGYVKLNAFGDTSVCEDTARQAMSRINEADAVIFDLQDNHGGFGSMVKLLSAYLFDHPEYLFSPIENTTRESWTSSPVRGNKLADKPIYILTSARTISAAEDFTYNLQMLKRATVVGEVTAGAAHAGNLHSIGDNFYVATIEVQAINPYSNHDWNGIGIQPDVTVSAADALDAALKLAAAKKPKR